MRLCLTELSAVTKWILSFGRNAIAIEPPELVDGIRSELMQMLGCYTTETVVPLCSPTVPVGHQSSPTVPVGN